jgi:hypothetical protein
MRALRARANNIGATFQKQNEPKRNRNAVTLDESSRKIMVTGGRETSKKVEELAYLIGYQVIARKHILMSNGTRGVDKISAEGALKACKDKYLFDDERIQVFRPREGSIPDFNFGTLHLVGDTYDKRRNHVVDISDVVIIIGGGQGTKSVADYAFSIGKPLIPIGVGNPDEVAIDVWQEMFYGLHGGKIGRDDLMKISKRRSAEQIALNSIILAENLTR